MFEKVLNVINKYHKLNNSNILSKQATWLSSPSCLCTHSHKQRMPNSCLQTCYYYLQNWFCFQVFQVKGWGQSMFWPATSAFSRSIQQMSFVMPIKVSYIGLSKSRETVSGTVSGIVRVTSKMCILKLLWTFYISHQHQLLMQLLEKLFPLLELLCPTHHQCPQKCGTTDVSNKITLKKISWLRDYTSWPALDK